jgi:hypothetical protein
MIRFWVDDLILQGLAKLVFLCRIIKISSLMKKQKKIMFLQVFKV